MTLSVSRPLGDARAEGRPAAPSSRLPGLHTLTRAQRLARLVEAGWLTAEEAARALEPCVGGFDAEVAEVMSENVVGVHGLPLGVCPNLVVDGEDRVAPMAVEEPSVIAAASNAARLVRAGGGFTTEVTEQLMAAQIEVRHVDDPVGALARLRRAEPELLAAANALIPRMVARGGGARALEPRLLPGADERRWATMVVHLIVDCRDAMGANLLNGLAEGIADRVAEVVGGEPGLRILTNFADRRLVRVRARVPVEALTFPGFPDGAAVRDGIARASRFAQMDPYRAVTHNKGFMNGLDAVLVATGQDWRQAEAAVHAWAARGGVYAPVARWWADADGHGPSDLVGEAEIPLAVGTVGGAARAHPGVAFALKLARADSAPRLAALAASVGLASNLAALKALSTEGIQRGHMALHARTRRL